MRRKPGAAVADAVRCAREHLTAGDLVVVATGGCEESPARGFLAAAPVLLNAGERSAAFVGRVLGRRPEVRTWR